jgi:hypothetical protein
MPSPRQRTESPQPTFVFRGTIKKLKSATMKDVPVTERTAIVTIDESIEAPPDLAGYVGQDITVELSGRQKVAIGQQMIFHATGWMFGESVAVRSLREEPLESGRRLAASTGTGAVDRHTEKKRLSHFADADLIVAGKVVAVRLPADSAAAKKKDRASVNYPITEHDPNWREAIIQVDDVIKGAHPEAQVIVRFPASSDVMWHGTSKFEAGQQGYFLLHRNPAKGSKAKSSKKQRGVKAGRDIADYYLALDSADFQPFDEPGGIRTALQAKSGKRKK